MDNNGFWGNLIREIREERRVSQRALSQGAIVNRSTLRRIEAGKSSGDIRMIERLLNFMGYELEAMAHEAIEERMRIITEMQKNPDQKSKVSAQRLLELSAWKG